MLFCLFFFGFSSSVSSKSSCAVELVATKRAKPTFRFVDYLIRVLSSGLPLAETRRSLFRGVHEKKMKKENGTGGVYCFICQSLMPSKRDFDENRRSPSDSKLEVLLSGLLQRLSNASVNINYAESGASWANLNAVRCREGSCVLFFVVASILQFGV
jgi:hypothetical protein